MVLCACSSKQLYIINRETKRIDPGSFIVMLQAKRWKAKGSNGWNWENRVRS